MGIKKTPNIILILKLLLYPFMLLLYFWFGKLFASISYFLFGLVCVADLYLIQRGVITNTLRYNTNLIFDSIYNITAFVLLVIDGLFALWYLFIFMILAFVSSMLSSMLVSSNFEFFAEKKIFLWLQILIWLDILYNFLADFETAKYVIVTVLFALYCIDIILKIKLYFSLPEVKQDIRITKEKTMLGNIDENKKEDQIAE